MSFSAAATFSLESGPPWLLASFSSGCNTIARAFCDQPSFEMGDRTEYVEDQLAGGGRSVDLLLNADQVYAAVLQVFDDFQQFLQGPAEAV